MNKVGVYPSEVPHVMKLFTAVIYEYSKQGRVFILGRHLQSSVMFVSKAGA